ncbi:MAG TPA: Gfo/Idh/MocA family oxidoreductase [Lacipirellulaceae bacterium]
MSKQTRRVFLQQAAAAAAAAAVLPKIARADVNSQLRMAVIGFNGQGRSHIRAYQDYLVALCDVDEKVLGRAADDFNKDNDRKLDQVTDFRRILDRNDIDAISIATPNHLHSLITILAAQSGKDVYCEKPLSHTVWEGRQVVNAAKNTGQIIQTGTQARSSRAIRDAVEYVRSGKLGKMLCVTGTCYKPRQAIGKLERPLQIPSTINYDLWCGPAAKVDLYRPKLHYDWHWDYNTGNGDMGNQGIHQMDVARWFHGAKTLSPRVVSVGGRLGYSDAGNSANTQVVLHDYPECPLIFETRGLPKSKAAQKDWGDSMDNYKGSQIGVVVECENGYVVSPSSYGEARAYDNDGNEIKQFRGGGGHHENFLAAVKSRKSEDLNAPALEGHLSSALCHTGQISHMLGEPRTAKDILQSVAKNERQRDSVERMLEHLRANEVNVDEPVVTAGVWLEMDPKTEQFTNNSAANDMLHRADRKPFVVPEIA